MTSAVEQKALQMATPILMPIAVGATIALTGVFLFLGRKRDGKRKSGGGASGDGGDSPGWYFPDGTHSSRAFADNTNHHSSDAGTYSGDSGGGDSGGDSGGGGGDGGSSGD